MSDKGKAAESGSHQGSEHLCKFGGVVTFDTGRFYGCPLNCGFTIAEQGHIVAELSSEQMIYISELYQRALNSYAYLQKFDVEAIGWQRLFEYVATLGDRYNFDPNNIIIKPDGKVFLLPNRKVTSE